MKNTGTENYGGPIVTAGGLVFIGATNFDKKFRAFDKDTGKMLWESVMVNSGNATPITYRGERQAVRRDCGLWWVWGPARGSEPRTTTRRHCRVCTAIND